VYDPKTTDYLHSAERKSPGAVQYLKNCVWCHGYDGKGQGGQMAPLAGNPNVIDSDSESIINIILNGAGRVIKDEAPAPHRMSSFRVLMSDADVAALSSFIRSAWGNKAPAVQEKEVSELRDKTNIASDRVVILKMR
jgi:mono/diheme cytochrome c family protein